MYPYGNKGRHYPRLDIASTDEDVVRHFAEVVDGAAVYGPIQRSTKKPFWRWQATGQRAVTAWALLSPYLGERRTARGLEVFAICEALKQQREEK